MVFVNIGNTFTQKKHCSVGNVMHYLNKHINSTFNFSLINKCSLVKIVNGLKNKTSTGPDGISTKLLKVIFPAICDSLILIINQSMTTGVFPDKLKMAKIIPLFKDKDPLIMTNYRPISLLSSISKLFEKVVFNQINQYFVDNKLYYAGQYGYREDHSTELANLELTDRILSSLDTKKSLLQYSLTYRRLSIL